MTPMNYETSDSLTMTMFGYVTVIIACSTKQVPAYTVVFVQCYCVLLLCLDCDLSLNNSVKGSKIWYFLPGSF